MYDGSRPLLYAVLAIPALLAGVFALVFVLSLGPLGLFVVVFVGLAAMATGSWLGEDESDSATARRINCPACGAPNDADGDRCQYCEEPLERA